MITEVRLRLWKKVRLSSGRVLSRLMLSSHTTSGLASCGQIARSSGVKRIPVKLKSEWRLQLAAISIVASVEFHAGVNRRISIAQLTVGGAAWSMTDCKTVGRSGASVMARLDWY